MKFENKLIKKNKNSILIVHLIQTHLDLRMNNHSLYKINNMKKIKNKIKNSKNHQENLMNLSFLENQTFKGNVNAARP